MTKTALGTREEPKLIEEMTVKELRESIISKKERYQTAKENYEFEYAPMILDEIKVLNRELYRRKSITKQGQSRLQGMRNKTN